MANSIDVASDVGVYKLDFESRLETRLNKPVTFKDVCDVRYTDANSINFAYMSTEFVAQTGTRGTVYGYSDFTLLNEQLNIRTFKLVPVFADRADIAQCSYIDFMDIADRSGKLLLDQVETAVLADHPAWTNVGDTGGVITSGSTSPITVTSTNIDNIVRGVRRIINVANGTDLAESNGIFFVWRAADFELLEEYAQNNGFQLADKALKDGVASGFYFLGAYHYISNSIATGHVMAGVRKLHKVGICNSTWGKLVINEDPLAQSGKGLVSRVDFGVLTPTGYVTLILDVNVS